MNRVKLISKATLAAVLVAGAFATAPAAGAKCTPDAVCPTIWDPVICSDGQTFSNKCFAAVACANGCVPYDGLGGK